jgi:TonB family protein
MAHNPIFGSDSGKTASFPAETAAEGGVSSSAARIGGESDLGELAAKFAAHGGGRVSPELSADLALEIVLNEIVEQACLATGATGAAIVLERGGEWVCRASAGGNAPQLGARLDTEAGLSGACVKTRTVQRCDDAQNDARADMEACRMLGVRSVMILPLLQKGELAGVFEVFAALPSAFGERDERTLEALSQRVLKNLEWASEPIPAAAESLPGVPANFAPAVLEKPIAPVTAPVTAPVAASVTEPATGFGVAASDASRDADEIADPVALDGPVFNAEDEAGFERGINVITWILGAAVIAVAVLLTVRVAERLEGGKVAARRHAPNAVSGVLAGTENHSAAAPGSGSGEQSAGSASSAQHAAAASLTPSSDAARVTDSSLPAGGLRVYENGKEVFRMPSAAEDGDGSGSTGASGKAATSADGTEMQRASAVEPTGIVAVSAEAAEGSLVHRVEPDYPEAARREQMQGPVVLDVRTDRDGAVAEVKVISGQRLLADAAIAAVKQWRFRPRRVKGEPVEMQTQVTLNFRLPR